MDVSVIVPCFNEAENLGVLGDELMPVIRELRRERSVEVIFVDDGSTDGTGDRLEERFVAEGDVVVLRHEANSGLGAALRTGIRGARGDAVVTTDSDGTYQFSTISRLLDLLQGNVDIVTASCYHPEGGVDNVPTYRIFLSRSASLLYRVLLDRHVHTYTCMVRAYRRRVLENVSFQSDGFLAVTELLANAMLDGYRVRELPCTLRVRRYGASKAKIARIIWSHLGFQLRLIQLRLRSSIWLRSRQEV